MTDEIKPPQLEASVGLEVYKTKTGGIGGLLKETAGDFIVREVYGEGRVAGLEGGQSGDLTPGGFVHFTLIKENWDTMRAVKEIARKVGVSQKRFSFAGTKDKHAKTAQRVSVSGVTIEDLGGVSLKDVVLEDFSYADCPVRLGDLWGNSFMVNVRDVGLAEDELRESVDSTMSGLVSGFPNFFGLQRFGVVRPITHEVGRKILSGDFEAAVMVYLTEDHGIEDDAARQARASLAETRDFKKALGEFPVRLGFEHALLNHLVEKPGDYAGALMRLPLNLRVMFVHAFQSYVFNRVLSECIKRDYAVERLPLVGYESGVDDLSARVLEEEGVSRGDFRVRGFKGVSSRGNVRDCFVQAREFSLDCIGEDEFFDGRLALSLSFRLPRGCYATVFLREFMKNKYW